MPPVSKRRLQPGIHQRLVTILIKVLASSNQTKSGLLFTQQFLSSTEQTMLAKRVGVALLLKRGYTYTSIMNYLKVSKGTVAKIAEIIHATDSATQQVLDKIISNKQVSETISDFDYYLSKLLPPKGVNWSGWRKNIEDKHHKDLQPI